MSAPSALTVLLESIASCFEGVLPASICTCSAEGTPNLTFLSIVHRIDREHVGLSYQFFNKTRKNVLENPLVQVVVASPETGVQYRLDLRYEGTETEGTNFDRMRTRLDAVASQTGMSQVFKLLGVDIYRVLDCRPFSSDVGSQTVPSADHLLGIERFTEQLAGCADLESLIGTALGALAALFGYEHSFLMVPDEEGKRLYTLASRGFDASGVGSEVWIGEGILGVAAERRMLVRSTNLTVDMVYSRAVRSTVERRGEESKLESEIALPGLPGVQSQLVAPLLAHNQLLGVLCVQSTKAGRFLLDDERVIQIAARHLAASMAMIRRSDAVEQQTNALRRQPVRSAITSTVKHYASDDSIFIDDAYLIKGVAGRIFWRLLDTHLQSGREDFTNKELRLDASLQLPDIKDNLEARLILLRRRLEERCDFVRLTQVRRGQFRLEAKRQLTLEEN
jgi:adenylate cyclase